MTLADAAGEDYCYLTTAGRVTGKPHTIEIWFGLQGNTLYLLAGGRDGADWVRNGRKTPEVSVRVADVTYAGRLRVVEDGAEDALARRLLLEKYAPGYSGSLDNWGRTALPVAIDVTP
jgi:nitroimidazol reductase NimA-like FMN-containing flavoprotein (pyridoxamine 5'-phosphate oxidase superfamily)